MTLLRLSSWRHGTDTQPTSAAEAKEREEQQTLPGYRARRWVVERSHSWLNRFRRLLIRWEKRLDNYLAMLHFACAWITYRAAGVVG